MAAAGGSNTKMKANLQEAAFKNVEDREKEKDIKKVDEKQDIVKKKEENEDDLLDWEDAEMEEFEVVGRA